MSSAVANLDRGALPNKRALFTPGHSFALARRTSGPVPPKLICKATTNSGAMNKGPNALSGRDSGRRIAGFPVRRRRRQSLHRICLTGAVHTGTMLALNDFNAPSHDQDPAASANANWRVCAVVLLLFIVAATLSAMRKDVTRGFDEVAHASYIADLQNSGEIWPAFAGMRMLDPSSFRFTGEANYLDHPSPYYLLLARLGPNLEGHPLAIVVHRLFNVALAASGLAALMAIGLVAGLPRPTLYAYIVPLACIPVLAPLAGAVNNDNAAFAGGAIATLAALQLLVTGSRAWLLAAFGAVIVASWDFGRAPANRVPKRRSTRCRNRGWRTGVCRNVRPPRHFQLSTAYRVRLADNRLPALLFTAGGPRSPCGAVIAGRHQTAVRPHQAAGLPDCRPCGIPPVRRPVGLGSRVDKLRPFLSPRAKSQPPTTTSSTACA